MSHSVRGKSALHSFGLSARRQCVKGTRSPVFVFVWTWFSFSSCRRCTCCPRYFFSQSRPSAIMARTRSMVNLDMLHASRESPSTCDADDICASVTRWCKYSGVLTKSKDPAYSGHASSVSFSRSAFQPSASAYSCAQSGRIGSITLNLWGNEGSDV